MYLKACNLIEWLMRIKINEVTCDKTIDVDAYGVAASFTIATN